MHRYKIVSYKARWFYKPKLTIDSYFVSQCLAVTIDKQAITNLSMINK